MKKFKCGDRVLCKTDNKYYIVVAFEQKSPDTILVSGKSNGHNANGITIIDDYNNVVNFSDGPKDKWFYKESELELAKDSIVIGDYVRCIGDCDTFDNKKSAGWREGHIFRVKDISDNIIWGGYQDCGVWNIPGHIRKCTPEEVQNFIPKKGDWIKITKSSLNWNSFMDQFIGKVVKVDSISKDGSNAKFKNDGDWCWNFQDKHFIKVNPPEPLPIEEKFKVGDWVQITKSDTNWTFSMNKFIGEIVQITNIISNDYIQFEDSGIWHWSYKDGHFKKVDSSLFSPKNIIVKSATNLSKENLIVSKNHIDNSINIIHSVTTQLKQKSNKVYF